MRTASPSCRKITAAAGLLAAVLFFALQPAPAQEDMISLNFDEVDITVFLKTMSDITGTSFIVSDKVQGNISFVSSRDIPRSKVYDIVLAILRASGFSAVREEEDVVRIHPSQEALRMSGQISYGRELPDTVPEGIVTHIVPLAFADANTVVNVVRPLFGNDLLVIAYPRTNALIVSGSSGTIRMILSIVGFLDTSIQREQSDIHIYKLQNADATVMAQTLTSLSSAIPAQPKTQERPQQPTGALSARFNVVANKETNSLIIISAPQDYEKIKTIIEELDLRREQVLVEALIVEITLDDDQSLGFDFRAVGETDIGVDAVAGSNTGLVSESIQTGGLPGLTVGLLNGEIPDVFAVLNANREDTDLKILSTPEIVTVNNNEAVINISEQIPFLTSSRVDENNNVIQTFDYRDIGIVLKLTPHINDDGYITMDIEQQIKRIIESTRSLDNPSVFSREITSTVTVRDRRTIVIGGLIRDDSTDVVQKVPILGDIPILGLLFRRRVTQRTRTNLFIFITPHIITEDTQIEEVTEQRRRQNQEFQDDSRKKRR